MDQDLDVEKLDTTNVSWDLVDLMYRLTKKKYICNLPEILKEMFKDCTADTFQLSLDVMNSVFYGAPIPEAVKIVKGNSLGGEVYQFVIDEFGLRVPFGGYNAFHVRKALEYESVRKFSHEQSIKNEKIRNEKELAKYEEQKRKLQFVVTYEHTLNKKIELLLKKYDELDKESDIEFLRTSLREIYDGMKEVKAAVIAVDATLPESAKKYDYAKFDRFIATIETRILHMIDL